MRWKPPALMPTYVGVDKNEHRTYWTWRQKGANLAA